jgi:X-X-X-Leu-X-X-Gly heptad repeat protein
VKRGAGLLRIGLGVWLTDGLNEGRELMEGLEGLDGAGVGRLTDGLGRLNDEFGRLNDGLGRLDDGLGRLNDGLGRLDDGLGRLNDRLGLFEDDLCWKLDMRLAAGVLRLVPSTRLPAIGEINVAATTAATAARDLIIFLVNILPLLGPPNVTAAFVAHIPAAYTRAPKRLIPRLGGPSAIPASPITLLFSKL